MQLTIIPIIWSFHYRGGQLSIYLLAFHLCFVSKTLRFCLQITCTNFCWSYCFLWHLVTQSYWDNRNVIINLVSYRPPTAHFCFTAPQSPISALPTPRVSHRPQGGGTAQFGNHWYRGMTLSLSLATFCRPNSSFAFDFLQHHVHIRYRRDYGK